MAGRFSISGLLFLAASLSISGQTFRDLSTTADGSTLYFSSTIRQKGTNQSFHSKILRWTASLGFQLVDDVADESSTQQGCVPDRFYQLHAPQVSADGSVLVYTGTRPIFGGRGCSALDEANQAVLLDRYDKGVTLGYVALSRNGRYVVTIPALAQLSEYHKVLDRTNGSVTVVAGSFNGSQGRLTNDGTTVATKEYAIILTSSNGATRVLPTKQIVDDAVIDPSGKVVVYVTKLRPPGTAAVLSSLDVQTGAEIQLATGFDFSNVVLTDDGSTVFCLPSISGTAGGVSSIPATGGSLRPVSSQITDRIISFTASGDGKTLFVATEAGLVRVDVTSGATTQLVPPTPEINQAYLLYEPATVAPSGSVITLQGWGTINIQNLSICGRQIPLLDNIRARFQVPSDLPEGTCPVVASSNSPFESSLNLKIRTYDPKFVSIGNGQSLVLHSYWSIIQTAEPAKPGEVIVAYMTGLGPVDKTGRIGPGFQCSMKYGPDLRTSVPAQVLYAGASPNYAGVYQVNVQVPDGVHGSASLVCGWNQSEQLAYASVPVD